MRCQEGGGSWDDVHYCVLDLKGPRSHANSKTKFILDLLSIVPFHSDEMRAVIDSKKYGEMRGNDPSNLFAGNTGPWAEYETMFEKCPPVTLYTWVHQTLIARESTTGKRFDYTQYEVGPVVYNIAQRRLGTAGGMSYSRDLYSKLDRDNAVFSPPSENKGRYPKHTCYENNQLTVGNAHTGNTETGLPCILDALRDGQELFNIPFESILVGFYNAGIPVRAMGIAHSRLIPVRDINVSLCDSDGRLYFLIVCKDATDLYMESKTDSRVIKPPKLCLCSFSLKTLDTGDISCTIPWINWTGYDINGVPIGKYNFWEVTNITHVASENAGGITLNIHMTSVDSKNTLETKIFTLLNSESNKLDFLRASNACSEDGTLDTIIDTQLYDSVKSHQQVSKCRMQYNTSKSNDRWFVSTLVDVDIDENGITITTHDDPDIKIRISSATFNDITTNDVEQSIKVCPARIVFTKIHTDSGNITPRSMLITFPSKLELDEALEKLSGHAGFSRPTGEEVVANSNQGSVAESSSPTG